MDIFFIKITRVRLVFFFKVEFTKRYFGNIRVYISKNQKPLTKLNYIISKKNEKYFLSKLIKFESALNRWKIFKIKESSRSFLTQQTFILRIYLIKIFINHLDIGVLYVTCVECRIK